jgi:serine/threonine protein kinase
LVGEDGIVKIADFGISKMLENGSAQKLVDAAGTPAFMSPELCSAEVAFSGQLADIWAIGATMFMLRYGTPPFVAGNVIALYNKIINDPLEFPSLSVDPGLRNLLVNMLEKDPKLRYSMDQVITHPWLRVAPPASRKISDSRDASHGISSRDAPSALQYTKKYVDEEAAAMNGPVNTVDKHDMFLSIGVGLGKIRSDDEDDTAIAAEDEDEDIMASNWALDVFEKVDDEDIDSDDDDDDDDASECAEAMTKKAEMSPFKNIKESSSNCIRTDMEEKEEDRRSQEFKKKFFAKNSQKNVLASEHHVKFGKVSNMEDSSRETSFRGLDREVSLGYLGEPVEEISMNDFEKMMDTLAMRPVSNASVDSDDSSRSLADGDFFAPSCAIISSHRRNDLNGTAAVYHSEQGCRKSQEDRCVLSLSLRDSLEGVSLSIDTKDREYLSLVSLGAVFDGHSGQKCAQYMAEHIIKMLASKPHFYKIRTQHKAITESFHEIDRQVRERPNQLTV